jgi:hypothetical protein
MTVQALLEAFRSNYRQPKYAALPQAPRTGSPVPWLTSLYHDQYAGNYGNRHYPGNCSGNLIRDLLFFFQPQTVFDPMTGGGTCKDVCDSLGIKVTSGDLKTGLDITNPTCLPKNETFDFVWLHPPYWRMIDYKAGDKDLSGAPDLATFRAGLSAAVFNCLSVLNPGGKLAILMGDYSDRELGFIPLVYETKKVCFELGLSQPATDIIRFSHGATSGHRRYRSSFIPGLHDVCMIFERKQDIDPETGEISAA